jgi:hypothetical protein
MPLIIVSIAIIVTPEGLRCLFCMILYNRRFRIVYICRMIHISTAFLFNVTRDQQNMRIRKEISRLCEIVVIRIFCHF